MWNYVCPKVCDNKWDAEKILRLNLYCLLLDSNKLSHLVLTTLSLWCHFKRWGFQKVLNEHSLGTRGFLLACGGTALVLGSLRSDDGDRNGNATKAIGLISKTTILHVHHAFLYISLPSLHDYDVKMRNFTMYIGRTKAKTKFPLSELGYGS